MERSKNTMPATTIIVGIGVSFSAASTVSIDVGLLDGVYHPRPWRASQRERS
jgi:hypothetical protein